MKDKRLVIYAVISVVLLLSPLFLNAYWVDVLNNVGLYTILALSLNIILGHAGLFHMGHAAFYALGAYTTAIINTTYHIPILWLLPVSGLVAGLGFVVLAWAWRRHPVAQRVPAGCGRRPLRDCCCHYWQVCLG